MTAGAATVAIVSASFALIGHAREQFALDSEFQHVGAASADTGNIPKNCYSEGISYAARICEFGPANATQTIALLGDSHAMQWFNSMKTAVNLQGWRLITVVRPGCAASEINPYRFTASADRCREWRSQAIETLIARHPVAVVITSYNGWTLRGNYLTSNTITAEEVRVGTRHTLAEFARAGVPVVVLRDTPVPPFDIPTCLSRHVGNRAASQAACDFDAAVASNAAAFAAERSAADGLANISFLDMNDLICPGTRCPAADSHWIRYRDENHLTSSFAVSLAPALQARLFQLPFTRIN